MKKIFMITAVIAMMLSFAACGTSESGNDSSSEIESQTTEAETSVAEDEDESETEPETEAETEEETEASEEESKEEFSAAPVDEDFTPVEGLSDNYADMDNRSFAYKGTIYTLGKNTLQDLIDGGIPFDENELNNAGNNVNKNYETSRYTVEINDFVRMQFTFMNNTDSNSTEAECLLSNVRWYTIYVPQPDYEDDRNENISNLINEAKKDVCFAFPLTLTKEQLLANNGDTTEVDEYNNVNYKVDSEVYYGSSGYHFEFNTNTNQLEEVSISWLP